MPNIVPTARYYPRLSEVITVDDLPEFLSFVQNGLNEIFDKIHYKNLQYSKSYRGDSAFYSLDIVSSSKLAIPLPFDLALVLNPDITGGDSNISSFPISLEYQWEILAFLKNFNLDNFSFAVEEFYRVGLQVFRISDDQVLAHILNNFVEPADENTSKFQQLFDDLNTVLDLNTPLELPTDPNVQSVISTIEGHPDVNDSISGVMFGAYILDSDAGVMKTKLQGFFNIVVPDGIEDYIKKLITPKAKATLALSAGIEFPYNVLRPINSDGSDYGSSAKSTFVFAEAQLYVDTEAGMGYQLELGGTLYPQFNAIGNTGIMLEIDSLKLDLSKNSNIIEADLDGRPNDFIGVYARAVSVTLPARWFHDDTETSGNTQATLRLGAYDLLVGSGGLSGTILLETVPVVTSGGTFEYFNDKFSFNYPIKMFEKNDITGIVSEKGIVNYQELKDYLQVLNASNSPYGFKFPLSLTTTSNVSSPISPSTVYVFNTAQDYQLFLSNLIENKLWKKIGGDNGFKIGFSKFDISFKQNKVLSSNIRAALEIPKFKYPSGQYAGQTVRIDIEGHLHDDGSFNLAASPSSPYDIKLPDVLTYSVKTVELGKDNSENAFYIGTSGTLKFDSVPILEDLEAIEIDRLRIYSDGSIEIKGGSIHLIKPIVLPLGPVEITVTAIHYGSHQKEVNGVMRKFNYFGFDGGVSIDPLGIEVRGDGVKLYYCSDNLDDKPDPYLHIQTLYIDLTIPASSPVAIINGWLSIPEPGTSPEYAGGIKIKLPKAKISGSADMKLMPKYPAFIIDAEVEFPAPIPLGSFAIYGFRGLLGYRYVAEKEAIGLVSGVNSWYEYYKAPPRGIHVRKFSGPNQTRQSGTPFSIGAGASLGTSYDNGTTLNIKAMVLLSVPSLFMIDGRASIISARLGLEETKDPPFFAFVAMGDNSLEFGFGADFKMPTSNGAILSLYADVQAGFFFNDSSKWYINIGTRTNPVTARILDLIDLQSYLMLSAKGIEAGARGEFIFNKTYGPVSVNAWAYVEVGGRLSFERPQIGGYIAAGVGAEINIRILHLYIGIDLLFGAESPTPFLIYGKFRLCVRVKICFIKIKFCGEVEISWDFNKTVDRRPVNPLISAASGKPIKDIVLGVNMLTNETFSLTYLTNGMLNNNGTPISLNANGIPVIDNLQVLPDKIRERIIPLDTYIDIKTEKGLLPGSIGGLIGGVNNAPSRYTDLVPPDKVVRGKELRQVKHQYKIEELSVKAWNDAAWVDYNPYKALYPNDTSPVLNTMKIGQWQKTDKQYNTIRLLATTPFSYTEQGEPGWYIPEQYGLTSGSLFCETQELEPKCADFISKPLGQQYYCYDVNHRFFSNNVSFLLMNNRDTDYAVVTDESNVFNISKSLSIPNRTKLEILLPESSVEVTLRLTSFGEGVVIRYYSSLINDAVFEVTYGHPETGELNEAYEVYKTASELNVPIVLNTSEFSNWSAISKIEILPKSPNQALVLALQEQIAAIEENNMQILLGAVTGEYQSTDSLEAQLSTLIGMGCGIVNQVPIDPVCSKDLVLCQLYNDISSIYNNCFPDPADIHFSDFSGQVDCTENILNLIKSFNALHPEYGVLNALETKIDVLEDFTTGPANLGTYTDTWLAVQSILGYLELNGDCNCKEPNIRKCYTLLHKVCWLSLEDYEFNINIPPLGAIREDSMATVAGITQFIQPIWRPDTSYIVHFKLKDIVDNGATAGGEYSYTYGFSTAGPVGFFHKHENSIYGLVKVDSSTYLNETTGAIIQNGVQTGLQEASPEKYPLTSLRQYIDYNRSYPNADGNLLSAKPLFYDDENNTKISVYFSKAYATHFFHNWEDYTAAGLEETKGRMKIVIKDPREDVSIVNPPSLDSVVDEVAIPQTIEEWTTDNNPLVPFVFNQWINLFLDDNCIGEKPEVIVPASKYLSVTLKKLKPQKLYTAIVNNMYDLNKDGDLGPIPDPNNPGIILQQNETAEVHRFVFQTSRYRSFKEQIESYILDEAENRRAIFTIDMSLSQEMIEAAYRVINQQSLSGLFSDDVITRLNANYQHAYDRLFEGVLGLKPLDEAKTTEFNIIRNADDFNKVIAIIVRNPEPFNNPKMTLSELNGTIKVMLPGSETIDNSYSVLFSKDCSQAIIMNQNLVIDEGTLRIGFVYKTWNGINHIVSGSETVEILL
ncbi:hypothetical protein FLJC2902T_12750 [Flavobacterium limnosediminis JC2902]|uniref:Uncharacterized protein n=1 Tax=Flavobacterium limnosediminis JC2902 TaxID=1341181 RepID=V6SQG6_9FLAO|nr:hypothetical protein [Flavobacterium limnosediminis]ESU28684.1 hypothetical protein FLJC2902T_12750 [Flavobacterium limnosediminis JC2902]